MANLRLVENGKEDVKTCKNSLRAYMKEVRADIDNKDVKAELVVKNTVACLEKKRLETGGNIVFVYQSFSTETSTEELIEKLKEKDFFVCCPKIENGEMYAVAYKEEFVLSPLGIREPIGDKLLSAPNYVVTPLLAVDKQGNRLGYGKGYYDRYFALHASALRIGYAFARQIIDKVPTEENDVKLHILITEDGILEIE